MCCPQYIKTHISNQYLVGFHIDIFVHVIRFKLQSLLLMCLSEKARYRVKGVWPRAAAFRLWYVATFLSLLCLCVSALPSAPVVLCLQELKLVLDPVTGIRSCEFQLLRWGLLWEKNKRRADKKLVQSPRQRNIQRKRKGRLKTKKQHIKVV